MSILKRARRSLAVALTTLLATGLSLVAVSVTAAPAHALCSNGDIGTWVNVNASANTVTKANLTFGGCDDQRLCDANTGICSGGTGLIYNIRLWGKCSPTDCDWGTTRLFHRTDGYYAGDYHLSFKNAAVFATWYPQSDGSRLMLLQIYNDFPPSDPRADYWITEWYRKVA